MTGGQDRVLPNMGSDLPIRVDSQGRTGSHAVVGQPFV
jgi:hypothetical protein